MRTAIPADLKTTFVDFLLDLPVNHKKVYDDIEEGTGVGYAPATMDLYKDIIDLRTAEQQGGRR